MPSLLILTPLAGLILLNVLPRRIARRVAYAFAFTLFSIQIAQAFTHHPVFWGYEFARLDSFFRVAFSVDHLSFVTLLSIGIVCLVSLIVTRYTVSDADEEYKFVNLLILSSIGMSAVVMVTDLFSMYMFLEVTAIASFVLIAFDKDLPALEGAFKYLLMSACATILMLLSIALLLTVTADTSFSAISVAVKRSPDNWPVRLAVAMFIIGLFIKGGVVPFHGWLPDAYQAAPGAVSILLAGIATKAAGIYVLIRLVTSVFGFSAAVSGIILILGTSSILLGAFAAISQTNIKRMLGYSSISQIGYILVGLGTATPLGIAGAIFHFFNHAIAKALLYTNSAALENEARGTDIEKMGGLSSKMPVTAFSATVAMLSAAGLPPLAGFWSKLMIVIALWKTAHYGYAALAVMASLVTLAYFLTLQRKVFFGRPAEGLEGVKEAPRGFIMASVALTAVILAAGICFPYIFNRFLLPMKDMVIR
jgi:multicomponent Na+:H+ antiporter subunit D